MPNNISGINPTGTPSSLDVFNASNQAISFKEQLPDLADKIRSALMSKFAENPLFAQRESAMGSFLAAPAQARADIAQKQRETGVPLSPTQQEAITSSRRAAAYAPLETSSAMLSTSLGGMEDIVGRGVSAFTSAATAQTERANLMNKLREQEIERQFKEKQLALDWARLGASESKAAKKDLLKQQEAMTSLNEALSAITNARNTLKSGGAGFSGILAGLRKRIPAGWIGAVGQETSALDSALSTVNKSIFQTAGKAFTKTEADILGGRVPKVSFQPEHVTTILDELERDLLTRQLLLLTGQYSPESGLTGNDWERV